MKEIYLIDPKTGDSAQLECDDIMLELSYSINDINNVDSRKDSISKTVQFKGTDANNLAFGSAYDLSRITNFTLENRLYYNYNSLRKVRCLVYDNGELILNGEMILTEVNVKRGNITYTCVITGQVAGLKTALADRLLSDLELTDLKHQFTWNNIKDSWETRTQVYSSTSSTYSYQPFEKGKGYVYPFVDNGIIYKNVDANNNVNSVPILQFRPAIYVKEYFDRIFDGTEGYTYEIKGSSQFKDKFDSLIIPSNVESFTSKAIGVGDRAYTATLQNHDKNKFDVDVDGSGDMNIYVNLEHLVSEASLIQPYGNYLPGSQLPQCVHLVKRTFTSGGNISVRFNSLFNGYGIPITAKIELCQRDFISADDPQFDVRETWSIIAASPAVTINGNSGFSNQTFSLELGERTYDETTQVCLRVHLQGGNFQLENNNLFKRIQYQISNAEMRFPKDSQSAISYGLIPGDCVQPVAPAEVKQYDFIRSVISLFNLYVYNTKENPKHLIFEQRDDFYALTSIQHLRNYSLDWSQKVDMNEWSINSNINLPKKYLFSWKEDSDEMNKQYKATTGEAYGQFRFADQYGIGDEKKVELTFSPSPLISYKGTNRIHPAFYQISNGDKKPVKTNVRLLVYNGLKSCIAYDVGKDALTGSNYSVETIESGLNVYPQCSDYFIPDGVYNVNPSSSLLFGVPRVLYFPYTSALTNIPYSYSSQYRGQISDLTHPDASIIECKVQLTALDIANLDLRIPVFIDLGMGFGSCYCRILNVSYTDQNSLSTVQLQKIAIQ